MSIALLQAKFRNIISKLIPSYHSSRFIKDLKNTSSTQNSNIVDKNIIYCQVLHFKISVIETALARNKQLASETLVALNKTKNSAENLKYSNKLSTIHNESAIFREVLKGLLIEKERIIRQVELSYLGQLRNN